MVTSTVSDVDETVVPVAVVNALKSIGVEAAKALFDDSKAEEAPPEYVSRVYLFKIVKRDYLDPKDGLHIRRDWGLIGASGSDVAYKKDE